jgi:hypothetical protein
MILHIHCALQLDHSACLLAGFFWRSDMEDLKPWWTSKAIWTGVIGSLWGVAGTLGVLPAGLDQADVLTVVLALVGIGGVLFRKTAKARIG